MTQRSAYGGQAVIEGVMIRGRDRVATACRLKDGAIIVRREMADTTTQRHPVLRLAFLRGTPALIDSLRLGYRTLMWSADQAMEGEEQQKPTGLAYFFTILGAFAFAIGIFVVVPALLAYFLRGKVEPSASFWMQFVPTVRTFLPNIAEGLLRILMLIVYILLISRMEDVKRIFSYHGAEHKVVNAWEDTDDLSVKTARNYSRIHPRCGTSFLFLVFIVGILMHSLIGFPSNRLVLIISRLIMLPIVAGVAYELIRLAGRFRNSRLLYALVWPGLLLQRLTTAEPADDQIEVALAAMRAVLEDEGVIPPEEKPAPEETISDLPLTEPLPAQSAP